SCPQGEEHADVYIVGIEYFLGPANYEISSIGEPAGIHVGISHFSPIPLGPFVDGAAIRSFDVYRERSPDDLRVEVPFESIRIIFGEIRKRTAVIDVECN